MNLSGSPFSAQIARSMGTSLRVGLAVNYRAVNGRPVADVQFLESGEWAWGVPVVEFGGTSTRYAHHARTIAPEPPSQGRGTNQTVSVLVAMVGTGVQRQPMIIGEASSLEGTLTGTPADADTARDPSPTIEDHALVNTGGSFLVTAEGEIVLDTTVSGRPVKVQLSSDGVLAIYRAGEANGRLVLAAELAAYIATLHDDLVTLQNRVAYLESIATPNPAAVIWPPVPISWPEPSADSLSAAAIKVSSETVS